MITIITNSKKQKQNTIIITNSKKKKKKKKLAPPPPPINKQAAQAATLAWSWSASLTAGEEKKPENKKTERLTNKLYGQTAAVLHPLM